MARSRGQDMLTMGLTDEEFGAVYSSVPREETFQLLPVKKVGKLGDGSNGSVTLMQYTKSPNVHVAAKNFSFNCTDESKNKEWKKIFFKETACLQRCDHKNIVKVYSAIMSPKRGMILIGYCQGGALYTENLDDQQVMKYFVSIVSAVQHIHGKRIIHRDIKLDNVLVKANHSVVLTDFGLADFLPEGNDLASGVVGTPDYMAPEVYRAKGSETYNGFTADSYSMGVFLYCLLRRDEPPEADVSNISFDLWPLLQGDTDFDSMNSTLRDCARRLLELQPEDRVGITSLYHRLGRCGYVDEYELDVDSSDMETQ